MNNKKIKKFFNCLFSSRRNKVIFGIGVLCLAVLITITFSASVSYDHEIKSVEITSSDWSEDKNQPIPGSWHIDKSGRWSNLYEATITFNLKTTPKITDRYKDVIFTLDISESMVGDKINKVINDALDLSETVLKDPKNRVAIVVFNSGARVAMDFTNDYEKVSSYLESIEASGGTNYYDALIKTGSIMENYQKEENRDAVILFLTDGYPGSTGQVGEYEYLKSKYPYLTINGIQYEMGTKIIDEIKEISDNQYLAYVDNLQNALYAAAGVTESYENFEITDFIENEFFDVKSAKDISVNVGNTELVTENGKQKIIWNLGENFFTGQQAKMTIKVQLKEKYRGIKGFYPTNEKESITSKLPENEEEIIPSEKTPVLYNGYDVIYYTNPPAECSLKERTSETYFEYELVKTSGTDLTGLCPGYQFNGWEISDKSSGDLRKVSEDTFFMPAHDVEINAVWTKLSISKSMTGTIAKKKDLILEFNQEIPVLDNVASEFVTSETGIDFLVSPSDTNGKGLYVRSGTEDFEYPIMYYRGEVNNNNVLFAGFCWKIVRTTETGGTKLLYNGDGSSGVCDKTKKDTEVASDKTWGPNYQYASAVGYMYNPDKVTGSINSIFGDSHASSDINVKNSDAKEEVDNWFEENMLDSQEYLEDAVWCNDRTFVRENVYIFGARNRENAGKPALQNSEACPNVTDRFTTSTTNGNGALKYPVGLITLDELAVGGFGIKGYSANSYLNSASGYFSMSPSAYGNVADIVATGSWGRGSATANIRDNKRGIRPMISLKYGITASSGTGTQEDPYIVE